MGLPIALGWLWPLGLNEIRAGFVFLMTLSASTILETILEKSNCSVSEAGPGQGFNEHHAAWKLDQWMLHLPEDTFRAASWLPAGLSPYPLQCLAWYL